MITGTRALSSHIWHVSEKTTWEAASVSSTRVAIFLWQRVFTDIWLHSNPAWKALICTVETALHELDAGLILITKQIRDVRRRGLEPGLNVASAHCKVLQFSKSPESPETSDQNRTHTRICLDHIPRQLGWCVSVHNGSSLASSVIAAL